MAGPGFVQELTWVRTLNPSSGNGVLPYPEAASQSFVKGDPVVLNASGQVQLAVDTGNHFGIAAEDASGVTNTVLRVIVLGFVDIVRVSQSNAGAAQNSAQTQVGLRCSYIKSSVTGQTTKTVLDTADTGNANFEIMGLRDPAGTENGEVYARSVVQVLR